MQKIHIAICHILAIVGITQAGFVTYQPASTSTAIVHDTPSAISHQSFTRLTPEQPVAVISKPHSYTPERELATVRILHQQPLIVPNSYNRKPAEAQINSHDNILASHTPAHLTYAARPVVHMMLPHIKPVRKISFESLLPGPRSVAYHH